jgi:hypothetical protein
MSPDRRAVVSLEAGSVRTVAAFEVADSAFLVGSVALQPVGGALDELARSSNKGAGRSATGRKNPAHRPVDSGKT